MERTGSSLLQSLLNSHPQICCEGELFRVGRWRRYMHPIARIWQHHPLPYLAYRQLRARLLTRKIVYGFKLHTKLHSEQVMDPTGFLHAVQRKDWKIIHLERASLFDQVISAMAAAETQRYFGHNRGPEPTPQLTLPVDELLAHLVSASSIRQRHRQILAGIPHMLVVYEDDLADSHNWPATVARISEYLNIPAPSTVETRVTKPWGRPYSELIINYSELVELARQNGYDV